MEIFHRKIAGANINSITQANYALFDLFKIKVNERSFQPKMGTMEWEIISSKFIIIFISELLIIVHYYPNSTHLSCANIFGYIIKLQHKQWQAVGSLHFGKIHHFSLSLSLVKSVWKWVVTNWRLLCPI